MLIFQIANKHLSKAVYCKGGSDGGSKARHAQLKEHRTAA